MGSGAERCRAATRLLPQQLALAAAQLQLATQVSRAHRAPCPTPSLPTTLHREASGTVRPACHATRCAARRAARRAACRAARNAAHRREYVSQRSAGARHDSLFVGVGSLGSVGSFGRFGRFGRLGRLGRLDSLDSLDSLSSLASHAVHRALSLPLGAIHQRQLTRRCSWTGARRVQRDG